MNYLQVIEVLKKMEADVRAIQIEEKLVECKRAFMRYEKDTTNL